MKRYVPVLLALLGLWTLAVYRLAAQPPVPPNSPPSQGGVGGGLGAPTSRATGLAPAPTTAPAPRDARPEIRDVLPASAPGVGSRPINPEPGTRNPELTPTTQPAVPKAPRPTTEIKMTGCVTDECHANVKQHKVLHGPVNVNACDACHTLTDAKTHAFKLVREPTKLCTFCHKLDMGQAKFVHKPLTTGDCIACHDSHGGFDRNLLRSTNMKEMCKTCHGDLTAKKKSVHGPVAAGQCNACHSPHVSDHPKLLIEEGRNLCMTCHKEMGQQLKAARFVHKPVETDCLTCHNPHASDFPMTTRAEPMQLCTATCHEPIRKAVNEATHKHSAVTQDRACVNCHTPHGSDLSKLMKDKPINFCLKCHDKPIKVNADRTVPAVKELADPKLVKHGPVKDGSCGGCHNVHGSNEPKLLNKPYPESFYAAFKLQDYDLCFSCHDKQLVLQPKTANLTGFRNGDMNLHYLHVNKDRRGRTCRACHDTHAGKQTMMVREMVPYGNWSLPINYAQNKTGGSCSPGCHQPLTYDRDNPVPRPVNPPGPGPGPTNPPPSQGGAGGGLGVETSPATGVVATPAPAKPPLTSEGEGRGEGSGSSAPATQPAPRISP